MIDLISGSEGEVCWTPQFLEPGEAHRCFALLHEQIAWRQPRVRIMGRSLATPRLSAWYGDPGAVYTYSGLQQRPHRWLPLLARLRKRVEDAAGTRFNAVLLHLYRDGNDSIAWHSDDEPELGANPHVASLSLGQARRFRMRHKTRREDTRTVELGDGALLLMRGAVQCYWQHCVPRTRRASERRINLSFRFVHPQAGERAERPAATSGRANRAAR